MNWFITFNLGLFTSGPIVTSTVACMLGSFSRSFWHCLVRPFVVCARSRRVGSVVVPTITFPAQPCVVSARSRACRTLFDTAQLFIGGHCTDGSRLCAC